MVAFPAPQDLRIKHVTAIKPLLKPEDRRQRVLAEAAALRAQSEQGRGLATVPDIIRALASAAEAPKRSGSMETVTAQSGKPLLHAEDRDRKGLRVTLLPQSGASRDEVDAALKLLLDKFWK